MREITKYWVWLTKVFGIGRKRLWTIMQFFETAEEAYERIVSGEFDDKLNEKERDAATEKNLERSQAFIDMCGRKNIDVVGYSEEEYPVQLRHIVNPPAVLYYRGNIGCLEKTHTATAVGSRKASDYALRAAESICGQLAMNNVVIVSGFAMGIDITSHMAAAKQGKPTVCVLGCGVDVDYPRMNLCYRDEILAAGGVFISEYPPGTQPLKGNFPKRNRILSALGRVTIIFEASLKSGSLITANIAAEQGRDVFCLPPSDIFSDRCSGIISFLRDGAVPLYSVEDVLEVFSCGTPIYEEVQNDDYTEISHFGIDSEEDDDIDNFLGTLPHKNKKNTVPSVKKTNSQKYENLTELQKKITEILSDGAVNADTIASKLDIDFGELVSEITDLEIVGVIRSLPGNMFELYGK